MRDVQMQHKQVVRFWPKNLRLDFFPGHAGTVLTKLSDTKLVDSDTRLARFTPPQSVRLYIQCDCACK
jgi:hypothetical protein